MRKDERGSTRLARSELEASTATRGQAGLPLHLTPNPALPYVGYRAMPRRHTPEPNLQYGTLRSACL